MAAPSPRQRPLGAWCSLALAVLLFVTLAPTVLAQDPPPFPSGGAGEEDDLALVSREWTETKRNGTVVDVVGTSHDVPGWEVAYRIHGDIAAIEGTLVQDADTVSPRPIFNTGLRLDRIEFEPPLRLASGNVLASIFPPALNWAGGPIGDAPSGRNYVFLTHVPEPRNGSNASADDDNDTTTGLSLEWHLELIGQPAPTKSTAMVRSQWYLRVPEEAVASDSDPNGTRVTYRGIFDFGDSALVRTAELPARNSFGVYMLRGNASATARVLDASGAAVQVDIRSPPGRPHINETARLGTGPTFVEASVKLRPIQLIPLGESATGEGNGWHALVHSDFGYLVDLPDPATTAPTPTTNGDTPAPAFGWVVLILVSVAVMARRTEAHT